MTTYRMPSFKKAVTSKRVLASVEQSEGTGSSSTSPLSPALSKLRSVPGITVENEESPGGHLDPVSLVKKMSGKEEIKRKDLRSYVGGTKMNNEDLDNEGNKLSKNLSIISANTG